MSATPLSDAMKQALSDFGLDHAVKEQEVFVRWEELVGTAIANHARPDRFRDGKLWIHVEDATWRHELRIRLEEMQTAINRGLGMELVRSIILR